MKFSFSGKYIILGGITISLAILGFSAFLQDSEKTAEHVLQNNLENRVIISKSLEPHLASGQFPEKLSIPLSGDSSKELNIKYTLDPQLQKAAQDLLARYRPDYSAIFMMDAKTGKVLVYASYQKDSDKPGTLLKKASYPAASIFKIVTATAAVDKNGLSPQHKIRFNGSNWTLYKKNVMFDHINRWTRTVTLREAFAKSMNTPFGKIGLNNLDPSDLENYAGRFMFNQQIPADFPVDPGIAKIPAEKSFELSEVACGYNKQNRMSPVQGAMIAATVINEGKMVVPYIVESISDGTTPVHQGLSLESGSVMSPASAQHVKDLMKETIISGTSRRSFASLNKNKKFQIVEMGGKTGNLTGDDPKGRVDWFVGYASNGDRQIAIGTVTVNKKYWTVKSSYIGQTLFKKAFDENVSLASHP